MLGEQEKYAEFIHFTMHRLSKGQTDKERVGWVPCQYLQI